MSWKNRSRHAYALNFEDCFTSLLPEFLAEAWCFQIRRETRREWLYSLPSSALCSLVSDRSMALTCGVDCSADQWPGNKEEWLKGSQRAMTSDRRSWVL